MQLFENGIIAITAQEALIKAQNILKNAYGVDVNIDPTSPNGLLIQEIANAFIDSETNILKVMYTLNPNIASGYGLDSIVANLNIERIPAVKSTAICTLTGLPNTIIPANSQIKSTNGDIFLTNNLVTINLLGTAIVNVTAQKAGIVLVSLNTINQILTNINGWDTVTNLTEGVIGTELQNDVQLRKNRIDALGFSSTNSIDSVYAGCATLSNVKSYYIKQNLTTQTIVVDGIPIAPISILTVLYGGNALEIANMLYKRTSIATSGNMSQLVTIPNTNETQLIKWQTAIPYHLKLNITLQLGFNYSPTIVENIANIMNTQYDFNKIGKKILASDILTLLNKNGIIPIINLTFDVATVTNQTNYTMKISDALYTTILNSNINLIMV